MDGIELLKTRRSVRLFTSEAVAREVVRDIVDCGRLAASARNIQPWEFVAVTEAPMRRQIAELATTGRFIADAPVCIAVLSRDERYYLEDGSAATQNLLLAARAHGLGSCWVAGDKKDHAEPIRALLGAPEGYRLVSLVAIGHAAATPEPPKRPLDEVLHWERF